MFFHFSHCDLLFRDLENIYKAPGRDYFKVQPNLTLDYLVNLAMFVKFLRTKGASIKLNGLLEDNSEFLKSLSCGEIIGEELIGKKINNSNARMASISHFKVVTPLIQITKSSDVSMAFSKVYEAIHGHIQDKSYNYLSISRFLDVYSELAQNILYHSNPNNPKAITGFVTAIIEEKPSEPVIILAVSDFGVGIPGSLIELKAKYRHFWNDSFAVTLALKEKVSRLKVDGRGRGLAGAYSSVKELKGDLWIRSGRGFFVHKGELYEAKELHSTFPGVQAVIRLPLKTSSTFLVEGVDTLKIT